MDLIKNGWFSENDSLWPGQSFSLKVEKVLYEDKSDYQDILMFKSQNHGTALVLDGIIQCTEYDEFAYQEMITFLPLCAHPNPQKVLIVGGGDGGVAREVEKHPLVKSFCQVEIDGKVIEACKEHLPGMAEGFMSPKLTLHVADGFEFMQNHSSEFDVIITDSSDPIGPAVNLFTEAYFQLLKNALKPDGIICSQAGTVWQDMVNIKKTMEHCKKHFQVVKYGFASVPTYPTGQIGFVIGSLNPEHHLVKPILTFTDQDVKTMNLKYYNSEIHRASFVLPNFARDLNA